MKQEKVDIYAIDALRVVSILAVVLIHTTTRVLERTGYNLESFPLTLFLNQFARFAVPLFFMISGFVLELHYHLNESYLHYLKKRINRIIIPYVFWSALYYFLVYQKHSSGFIQALISGDASYQLYFIPSLLIFYIIFPFLHKIYKYFASPLILTLLGYLEFYILYTDYYVGHLKNFFPINIVLFNFFIFILGMIASHHYEKIRLILKKIFIVLVPITIYLLFGIYSEGKNLYFKTYDIGKFYSQWRPDVLIYTICFAGVFYYLFTLKDFGRRTIRKLSRLSFFVYFVHVIVIEAIWNLIGTFHELPAFDIFFFTVVSGISFLVAFIFHRTRGLYRLTG